jgi:hypothetical protein
VEKLFAFLFGILFTAPALAQVGAWPATVFLDSNNQIVANYTGGDGGAVHKLQSAPGYVNLGPYSVGKLGFTTAEQGFITAGFLNIQLFYNSANCSGTPYMSAEALPIRGYANDAVTGVAELQASASVIIYHPKLPYQIVTFNSVYQNLTGQTPGCYPSNLTINAGLVTSEIFTAVPPFHLNVN